MTDTPHTVPGPDAPLSAEGDVDALIRRQDALIEAALPHIAFDGWSMLALRAAAKDLDTSMSDLALLFPGGVPEAVSHFLDWTDRQMLAALAEQDLLACRVPDRITRAIKTRLDQAEPHKEAVRRTLAWLSLPQNAPLAASSLYRTVDAIWYAAGDKATDFNYYTKRATLAGVYSTTLLYWLYDGSEGHRESWAFLERRLGDVGRIGRLRAGFKKATPGRCPNPFRMAAQWRNGLAGLGRGRGRRRGPLGSDLGG